MSQVRVDAVPLPPITAEQLPDDVPALKGMIVELVVSLHEHKQDLAEARHRLKLLTDRLYGARTERIDPNQPLLFEEPVTTAAAATTPPTEAAARPKRRARPHGRRRLPENLPHEPRHHELTQAERVCAGCGAFRVDIGTDQSEQLEYRPASLFVVEHFVHKYVCPCCSKYPPGVVAPPAAPGVETQPMPEPTASAHALPTPTPPQPAGGSLPPPAPSPPAPCRLTDASAVVIAAAKPALPIAKGLPGPGLLAHLIVSKYTDHLPLHRLERIYERQGVFLPRSTLSDWLAACARLLQPLYDRMVNAVLRSAALHTDDTTVKMQDPKTHLLSTARLWGYLGDARHPYNVFDFTVNRKRDGPAQFLTSYQGYLQADAFSGYDGLYLPDPKTARARITEVACNAHARRKFYEARDSDTLRAHQALAYYRQLYELERAGRDLSDSQRLQMRQDLSVPILEKFHAWLQTQRAEVLPKSPMGDAIGYALNHWAALVRYTEAGFLDIDNNVAEREMKQIAIGRKNWLTVGSPRGGQTAAILLSFTSTCRRLGVEPWAYLQDVLTRLPTTTGEQLDELLPDRWEAARRARQAPPPSPTPDPAPPSAESIL